MKLAATSIAAGARKKQEIKNFSKTRKNKTEVRRNAAYFCFWSVILSHSRRGEQGARRPEDIPTLNFNETHGRHIITDTGDTGLLTKRKSNEEN